MGGHSGSSEPTLQQRQLQTQQALATANLNLQENDQRKAILNAMQGTRVFRGSALSRAVRGDTPGGSEENATPASASQLNSYGQLIAPAVTSLVDPRQTGTTTSSGAGSTPAGGTGGSGGGGVAPGGGRGGSPSVRPA